MMGVLRGQKLGCQQTVNRGDRQGFGAGGRAVHGDTRRGQEWRLLRSLNYIDKIFAQYAKASLRRDMKAIDPLRKNNNSKAE